MMSREFLKREFGSMNWKGTAWLVLALVAGGFLLTLALSFLAHTEQPKHRSDLIALENAILDDSE